LSNSCIWTRRYPKAKECNLELTTMWGPKRPPSLENVCGVRSWSRDLKRSHVHIEMGSEHSTHMHRHRTVFINMKCPQKPSTVLHIQRDRKRETSRHPIYANISSRLRPPRWWHPNGARPIKTNIIQFLRKSPTPTSISSRLTCDFSPFPSNISLHLTYKPPTSSNLLTSIGTSKQPSKRWARTIQRAFLFFSACAEFPPSGTNGTPKKKNTRINE
jgi:hypothetical protein